MTTKQAYKQKMTLIKLSVSTVLSKIVTCNRGSCGWISLKIFAFEKILRTSLDCKLVPVQPREYEYCLLQAHSILSSLKLYRLFYYFFLYSGSLTLYSIKNQKGLPQTRVTSVSDGKGSWACKKVTVSEVSVDRQVGQIRFYLNLVIKVTYPPYLPTYLPT